MNLENKTLFITGGSGFLGRTLCNALRATHPKANIFSSRIDVLDPHALASAVPKNGTVIHLAAVTHTRNAERYRLINIEGTKNLIEAAKVTEVEHFVYISTTAIGEACGSYGASKAEAESLVMTSGLPFTIIRPAEVYGGDSREGIDRIISLIKRFRIGLYMKNAMLAPVYLDDVVQAIVQTILITPRNRIYTISGPNVYSFIEVVKIIAEVFDKKIITIPLPRFLAKIGSSAPDQVSRLLCVKDYDITLARSDLSFTPRTFREGLKSL